jgi:hypothetical protein
MIHQQIQCHSLRKEYYYLPRLFRFTLVVVTPFCFTGCGKSWNPDEQFQSQVEQISLKQDFNNQQDRLDAKNNISEFEMILRNKLVPGTSENELVYLLGNSYDLLARTLGDDLLWERRSYDFNTLIKNRYGANSLEFALVQGNPTKRIIVTSNSRFLITTEPF